MNEAFRQYLQEGSLAGARYALHPAVRVPVGVAGANLGKAPGSSLEFMDHRDYQPGDDLRRIDWSAYARSDRLIVKLYREEVTPHVELLLDGSKSMALPGSEKSRASVALTAALAEAARNAEYSHTAYLLGDHCRPIPGSGASPAGWEGIGFESTSTPLETLQAGRPAWRRGSVRIFISDLLFLGDPHSLLSILSDGASSVIVVQALARDDVKPPRRGNLRLVDSETAELQEVFVDAVAQRRYSETLARHQDLWARAAHQVGAAMVTVVAETLCRTWDLRDLIVADLLECV